MEKSMVQTHILRDGSERGKPSSSKTALEVSVSFGRFENESLSWERWSSFSQNKYLEEVEKCSTPGSVAEKKAYFEAHYKKIAARMAEETGQEVRMVAHAVGSDGISGDPDNNGCELSTEQQGHEEQQEAHTLGSEERIYGDPVSSGCNTEQLGQEVRMEAHTFGSDETISGELVNSGCKFETESGTLITDAGEPTTNSLCLVSSTNTSELDDVEVDKDAEVATSNKEAAVDMDCQGKFSEEVKEELEGRVDNPKLITLEIGILEGENNPMRSRATKELSEHLDNGGVNTQKNKVENSKMKLPKESQKRTPATKTKSSMRTKNNSASHTPKSSQIAIPKTSPKPRLASDMMSTAQNLATKGSQSSLPKSPNISTLESRRLTKTSLSKSLVLQPKHSESASPVTMRKSFIMEKMGDKEIVKRAFKAFQNSFNQLSEAETSTAKQVPTEVKGQSKTAPLTRKKQFEGTRNAVENARSPRTPISERQNSALARPLKTASVDHLRSDSSSSLVLRSSERAEKRKEFLKKLEKSNAKEVEKIQLQSKSKEEKDAGVRKLRQSLNFKATPMPDFYGGRVSKTPVK